MERKPLYEDNFFKVEYLPTAIDEHILSINDSEHGWMKYILQRGILEDLAKTPVVDAVRKVKTINELILCSLEKGDVGLNFLFMHNALCIAYATEEKSRQEYIKKMRDQRDAQ